MSNAKISKFVGQWVKKILSFKIYKCTHCNDETNNKFTKKSLLEKHIKEFHLEFFCNYCASCGFTTQSHLEEHMKKQTTQSTYSGLPASKTLKKRSIVFRPNTKFVYTNQIDASDKRYTYQDSFASECYHLKKANTIQQLIGFL